jgi:hypothetical protein
MPRRQPKRLNAALRACIVRAAARYGAPDADDVAQVVMMDCITRPWLTQPCNIGALMQRTRFHVLHALRSARRHDARGEHRFTSYEQLAEQPTLIDDLDEPCT